MAATTAGHTSDSASPSPNVLSKSPVPIVERPTSVISRRHSWTSTTFPLTATDMSSSATTPTSLGLIEDTHDEAESSSLSDASVSTGSGTTLEITEFLRNTGPPTPPETLKIDDVRKTARKRNRGFFRKWRDIPEIITNAEETKPSVYVPSEGVEQKTTAQGNKYLQIVTNPVMLDHVQNTPQNLVTSAVRASVRSDHTVVVESDALDTWIQSLSLQDQGSVPSSVMPVRRPVDMLSHFNPPGVPQSYVAEANSWLPPAESGFGLSIIDDAAEEPCYRLAAGPDGGERLFESFSSSYSAPMDPSQTVSGGGGVDTPLLPERIDSLREDGFDANHGDMQGEENGKAKRRPSEVLAGQGLRRPGRDNLVNLHNFPAPSHELFTTPANAKHRKDDAEVRAQKIKMLQQARRNIDEIVKERLNQRGASPAVHELVDALEDHLPALQYQQRPKTAPDSGKVVLSQVMLVAEQVPVPRGRQIRKPAPLLLRDRSMSGRNRAVRSNSNSNVSVGSPQYSIFPPRNRSQKGEPPSPPPSPPAIPTKSSTRNTPTTSLFTPQTAVFTPNSIGGKTAVSTPLTASSRITVVTATGSMSGGTRTSVSSSLTSASKEARLGGRIEALERENRLLEAALLAVLKTSGTLNRCPCAVLKECSDHGLVKLSHSRSDTPLPSLSGQQATSGEPKRVNEEGIPKLDVPQTGTSSSASSLHTRRASVESTGSGISALDVYLRTKIGHMST